MVLSLWAMAMTVRPLISVPMAFCISTSFSGSSEAVASSSKMICASFSIARAMDIRCFSPPESVPLRQAHYEIVATGFLGGSDDFFIHCIGFTEADIVAYRILKQTDILKNHRDVAHQAFRCYFIHRNTVEKEVSLLWIVETGTKLHHRAFPTVPSSSVRHELT